MTHFEIEPDFFLVLGYSFPKCNTLVLIDEELTVVDPGCNVEDIRALLQDRDLTLRDIDTVILTHIHPDHITHAMRLNRLSKCRIVANEITAPLFNDKEKMKEFLGFHKGQPVRAMWEQLVNSKMYGCLDDGVVAELERDGAVTRSEQGWVLHQCFPIVDSHKPQGKRVTGNTTKLPGGIAIK